MRLFFYVALLATLHVSSVDASDRLRRATDHVVLISLDGLRPEFYLDEAWPAPMMQKMHTEGAHAKRVRGIFPSVTYPTHTTILTGLFPAQHGIDYNAPFEPQGQSGRWYWEETEILAPTLWDAAEEAGLITASVFWPVSVGAPIDFNIPEIWPLDDSKGFLDPIRRLSTPTGILEEIEREATGRLSSRNFSFGKLSLDDRSAEMASYLLTEYRPNFLTIHLIGADTVQHNEGTEGVAVRLAVAAMDRLIARLVEAAEAAGLLEKTTFIVTGDHGFVDLQTEIAPNVWFVEAGLLEDRPDRGDWRAALYNTSAAGFVHLANPDDDSALAEVLKVLEHQPAEIRTQFKVLDRGELAKLETAPRAALALAPATGVYISSRTRPPAVRERGGASHGHLPDLDEMYTGFVAWGAGIRQGTTVDLIGIEQIAPLVRDLLGLELSTSRPAPDVLK
jgi:predicted AlkP superfamily pyrophosphatase or phosphodiesterase